MIPRLKRFYLNAIPDEEDTTDVAQMLSNLGRVVDKRGRLDEAVELYRETLEIPAGRPTTSLPCSACRWSTSLRGCARSPLRDRSKIDSLSAIPVLRQQG